MEGDPNFRAWNELIPDALGLIFSNLKSQEVLEVIPLVCKSWCKVVEGPCCWKRIDIKDFGHELDFPRREMVELVLRTLLPRSSGSLRELRVSFIDDYMLSFIAKHAGSLETLDLEVSWLSGSVFEQFATKLGSLTTLIIRSNNGIQPRIFKAIGHNCKRLVSLSWLDNISMSLMWEELSQLEDEPIMCSMPNLKHLSLHYALLTNSFVLGLLSGCPGLEYVEIQGGAGLTLDLSVVKEKFPNIVTLDIGNEAKPHRDYSDEEYDEDLLENNDVEEFGNYFD